MYAWKMGLLGYSFYSFICIYLLRQNLILLPKTDYI